MSDGQKLRGTLVLLAIVLATGSVRAQDLPAIVTFDQWHGQPIIRPANPPQSDDSQPIVETQASHPETPPTGQNAMIVGVGYQPVVEPAYQADPGFPESRMMERPVVSCPARGLELGVDSIYFHEDNGGDFATSGRVWFGYQFNDYFSVRTRIWLQEYEEQFSQVVEDLDVAAVPPTGFLESFQGSQSTELNSLDIEFRRKRSIGMVNMETFLGVKYIQHRVNADFNFNAVDLDFDEVRIGNNSVRSDLSAIGFEFGFDSVIPFRCAPNIGLVANLSGAIAGGSNNSSVRQQIREFRPNGAGNLVLTNSESVFSPGFGGESVWIGHAQIGLQYARPLPCCGGARFTARGLFEFQTWSLSTIEFAIPNLGALPLDISSELAGFSFGVGFER